MIPARQCLTSYSIARAVTFDEQMRFQVISQPLVFACRETSGNLRRPHETESSWWGIVGKRYLQDSVGYEGFRGIGSRIEPVCSPLP